MCSTCGCRNAEEFQAPMTAADDICIACTLESPEYNSNICKMCQEAMGIKKLSQKQAARFMAEMQITDIDWETDDEDVDLPSTVMVPSDLEEDEIADYLSDNYGWLVNGFVMGAETFGAEGDASKTTSSLNARFFVGVGSGKDLLGKGKFMKYNDAVAKAKQVAEKEGKARVVSTRGLALWTHDGKGLFQAGTSTEEAKKYYRAEDGSVDMDAYANDYMAAEDGFFEAESFGAEDWGEGMTIPQKAKALSKMSWDEVDGETGYGDDLFDWFDKWDKKSQKERETYALRILKESYGAESFGAETWGVQIYDTDLTMADVKKMLKDAGIKTKGSVRKIGNGYGYYFKFDSSHQSKFEKAFKKFGKAGNYEYEAESFGAESKFDKLANKIAAQYRKKGKSAAEAKRIGQATAAKIGFKKYGKKGMVAKAQRGRRMSAEGVMGRSEIPFAGLALLVLGYFGATKLRKKVTYDCEDCGCKECEEKKAEGYPEVYDPVQDFLPKYRYPKDSVWSNDYNPADPYRALDYQTVHTDSNTKADRM